MQRGRQDNRARHWHQFINMTGKNLLGAKIVLKLKQVYFSVFLPNMPKGSFL